MANDFTGDSDCVALWRFESGALTTDTIGTNTLTNNAAVAENAVDYKEGAGSADFESGSTQYFDITDANLDAGFPLKNGDSNKKISMSGWFRLESFPVLQVPFSKWDNTLNSRSFVIQVTQANEFRFLIGTSGGASSEIVYDSAAIQLSTGRWYHYGITFQDSDKSWKVVVWDDTGSSKIINASGNSTNNINIEDAGVAIGSQLSNGVGSFPYDGEIDEIVVFKDILTTGEIDEIRQGVFGAPLAISAAENVVVSEVIGIFTDLRHISVSEGVAVTEALDILHDEARQINLSESVAVTEVIGRLLGINPSVIDTVAVTEYNKMLLISFVDANETIRVREFIRSEVFLVLEASVNSAIAVTEVVGSDIHFPISVSEVVAAQESYGLYKTPGGGGRMTFSGKKPKITFTGKAPSITFTGAAPKITFSIN